MRFKRVGDARARQRPVVFRTGSVVPPWMLDSRLEHHPPQLRHPHIILIHPYLNLTLANPYIMLGFTYA